MTISVGTGGGANGGNCPPPTGARAGHEIDANPMSFQKMEGGRREG